MTDEYVVYSWEAIKRYSKTLAVDGLSMRAPRATCRQVDPIAGQVL